MHKIFLNIEIKFWKLEEKKNWLFYILIVFRDMIH